MIYTTNRRVWEWDEQFRERLRLLSAIGIDMETATVFIVGHVNQIPRGALLLVSDAPMTPERASRRRNPTRLSLPATRICIWTSGIRAMTEIGQRGEEIKHFGY